jgi:iron complex outermembrane receptor protein
MSMAILGVHTQNSVSRLYASTAFVALALGLCSAPAAYAQDAASTPMPAEPAAADTEDDTIVVTGSRIVRNGFNAPTPVTIVDSELINNLGQVSVADTLRLIPQNSNFQSDASAGITAGGNVGSSFANLRGLNPFFGTRTLTLVNSRRFIPTSDGGAVDLNVIPSAMIQRVETVTGGASAAYGSDAIAGVVNILLDTKFQGVKAQADFGQTSRGDGKSYHGSLTFGTGFAGGRGHIVVGGEYQDNKGIGDCAKVRLWCAESYDVYTNASNILPGGGGSGYNVPGSPGYGQPNFIVGPGSRQAYNDPHGVVRDRAGTALAARNFRFNDAGTGIIQFDPGNYISSSLTGARQGGDGASTYDDSDLQTPVRRAVGYLYSEFEVSDAFKISTELTYANRRASNTGVTAGPRSTFLVKPTNAFLPASLQTLLAGTSFSLGKDLDGQVESENEVESDVFRGLIGASGSLGGSWKWDAYYQYGHNARRQDRTNSRVNTPFQYALDAVTDPVSGKIVCAETLKATPNPLSQGCRPLNLFGIGNLDPAAVAYAYRPVMEEFRYKQHVLAGSIQGELFKGWGAGPIKTAAGIDYRSEGGDVYHGDIPNYTDYAFTFGLDYAGDIEVLEGFTELSVPVFRDFALGRSFDLDGAIRYTRNHAKDTISGEEKTSKATSWKVSGVYDIVGGFRLRASRSRDIRAAGFRELFLKNVATESGSSQGIVDNPNIPGSPAGGDDPTPILSGGSFSLTPEKADTTTFGAVYSPEFIEGLRLSLDWYQIKLNDAVTTLSGQRIVDFCSAYNLFCDRITRNSATDITFVDARQVNLARLTVRGFDIEAEYHLPLQRVSASWNGRLGIRVLGTNQYDFISKPNQTVPGRDYAGQSGPVQDAGDFNPSPKWIWNSFFSYDVGGFNATASVRHIGKGILNVERIGPEDPGYDPKLINSISTNRVKGATYVGMAMSYEIPLASKDRHIEIFGTIDNLFDTKPPVAPGGGGLGGSNYPTNPVFFDTFGSRYRFGLRVRY